MKDLSTPSQEAISQSSLQTIIRADLTATDSDTVDKQLRLLQAVRTLLSRTLEPDEFFRTVCTSVHDVFGYPLVGIYMIEGDELIARHIVGNNEFKLSGLLSHEVIDEVIKTGEPVWIADARQSADSKNSPNPNVPYPNVNIDTTSNIAVPLFVRGNVAGALTVVSNSDQPLTLNDLKLIQTLSEYVSFGLEQMRLFTALRRSEQRARALLDTVPDLMFVHGRDGTYLDFHTTRFDRPKVPLETAMGKKISDIFGMDFEKRILPVFSKALDTGEVQSFEYNFPEADGEEHYFEARVIAYEPEKVLSLVRDITKEKQIEQLQAQRVRELEEASRAKNEFLATMSHELRTPLHSMLTLGESLREEIYGPISKNQGNVLTAMEKSGRHLLALINDILDIAKIEAGKLQLDMQRTLVRHAVQTSLEIVQEAAHRKNIQILQLVDDRVLSINADERRLVQILVNLLSNAIKFTPENGSIGVEVIGNIESKQIQFIVWDTGIGIAKENRDKLFKPFVQLDSSLSRQYEGTGLGLALVRRLTEMHGGDITVESLPQKGSRFTVSLPWNEVPTNYESRIQQRLSSQTSRPAQLGNIEKLAQEGPTVLLAEDNLTSQEAISTYLSAHSYKVITASNGAEAIMQAAAYQPDLILMDIQMPEMDGLQATKQIRRNNSLAKVPIVALTALAMPGDKERCFAAGVNEYLSKPVSMRQLMQVIETQLTKDNLPLPQ